ncbi:hypothetical protein QBC36DRAFT_309648 [Triangularia setosa]|uniref:Uncharacterized protein n=1 Tax=Triangularia setosa TaxID=2587417 RepID=A0AAN7A799_9PEZI|nr:hypothetical protein QBC36DRAFT_309648 [Podospora setosa]
MRRVVETAVSTSLILYSGSKANGGGVDFTGAVRLIVANDEVLKTTLQAGVHNALCDIRPNEYGLPSCHHWLDWSGLHLNVSCARPPNFLEQVISDKEVQQRRRISTKKQLLPIILELSSGGPQRSQRPPLTKERLTRLLTIAVLGVHILQKIIQNEHVIYRTGKLKEEEAALEEEERNFKERPWDSISQAHLLSDEEFVTGKELAESVNVLSHETRGQLLIEAGLLHPDVAKRIMDIHHRLDSLASADITNDELIRTSGSHGRRAHFFLYEKYRGLTDSQQKDAVSCVIQAVGLCLKYIVYSVKGKLSYHVKFAAVDNVWRILNDALLAPGLVGEELLREGIDEWANNIEKVLQNFTRKGLDRIYGDSAWMDEYWGLMTLADRKALFFDKLDVGFDYLEHGAGFWEVEEEGREKEGEEGKEA